jgi:hypothetical protein
MITKTDSTTNSGSKKQQPSGKKLKNWNVIMLHLNKNEQKHKQI